MRQRISEKTDNTKTVDRSVTMIGFPSAGKTTYLAALYGDCQRNDHVAFGKLPEDTQYLDEVLSKLEGLLPMPRSPGDLYFAIALDLVLPPDSHEIRLVLPDVTGEEFDAEWEKRLAREDVQSSYSNSDGYLLFVRAKVEKSPTISEMHAVLGDAPPSDEKDVAPEYDPEKAPLDVKLVGILQIALERRPEGSRTRIAVIASAWDEELKNGDKSRSPSNWLRQDLPLTWQFMESNLDLLEYSVFGVSAQGGNYAEQAAFLERKSLSERPIVATDKGIGSDISQPLRWVLGI